MLGGTSFGRDKKRAGINQEQNGPFSHNIYIYTRGKTPGLRPGNGSPMHFQASSFLYVPPVKKIFEKKTSNKQYFINLAKMCQNAISVRKSYQ